ncbi:hypothetical protein [Chitinimonas lacunae]|uniref:Spondin domain-containing protein n=1 Tax=Chitinimonas lacunae TaxID=1963018 RepID=A0ABV8MMC4_9NEIS
MKKHLIAILACCPLAYAEVIPGTHLSIEFQAAQIQGTGRNIHMYRIPVKNVNTGVVTFYNAEFEFGIQSDGSVGFTRVKSAIIADWLLGVADNFNPGTYQDTAGNLYTLSGPALLNGGRHSYTLSAQGSGKVWNATWVTGPLLNHPLLSSGATPKDGSAAAFGVMGSVGFDIGSTSTTTKWCSGGNIGASQQAANLLLIARFHNECPISASSPYQTVVLTRQ